MLIYNTTYTMPNDDARGFVIWVKESMLPRAEQEATPIEGRLLRILSHHDQETECFSVQLAMADTTALHRWYIGQGKKLNDELLKMFGDRIVAFSTIMEEV